MNRSAPLHKIIRRSSRTSPPLMYRHSLDSLIPSLSRSRRLWRQGRSPDYEILDMRNRRRDTLNAAKYSVLVLRFFAPVRPEFASINEWTSGQEKHQPDFSCEMLLRASPLIANCHGTNDRRI